MAELKFKKFRPSPEEVLQGATPMSQVEILDTLAKYKVQNPVKYEAKKAALFAKYGLTPEDVIEPEPDANDIELAEMKAKLVTPKKAK